MTSHLDKIEHLFNNCNTKITIETIVIQGLLRSHKKTGKITYVR